MSKIEVFESTLQKTEHWLNELSESLDIADKQMAYKILRGVLHSLRDRLPAEVAVKLSAQLPMLVRGFYFENWVLSQTPIKVHSLDNFISLTAVHFPELYSRSELEYI